MDNDTPGLNAGGGDRLEGRVLADRYRIESFVASGANTIIVEGIDTESDLPVTIKVVRPERAIHESFRSAFRRQVAIAQSLVHPNIAKVLDSGELEIDGETTLFWVVEYLGGGSLRDLFDRGRLARALAGARGRPRGVPGARRRARPRCRPHRDHPVEARLR